MLGGERILDRQQTIGRALEALARILGPESIAEMETFLDAGLERAGLGPPGTRLPLEVYEKLAPLRSWAVHALSLCGDPAREAIERASRDPDPRVAAQARDALRSLRS